MNDARRYRMNAAECLLAAKTCEPSYRSVLLTTSAAWYALAIQDEEVERLLAKWSEPAPVQVPATAEISVFPIVLPGRRGGHRESDAAFGRRAHRGVGP
jgi:hypothetical protein